MNRILKFYALQKKWIKRYERALNGEIFKESQQIGERYMDYSLSPIVGRNGITGVSIFARGCHRTNSKGTRIGERK